MANVTDVDTRLLAQLRGIQDTVITLISKGEFAMNHGDYRKAEAYFAVAQERDPYNASVQSNLTQLHALELRAGGSGLFDQGTQTVAIPHFVKTERLAPLAEAALGSHANDPRVKELRRQEIASYNALSKADATLRAAQAGLGSSKATQADVDRAQQAVDAAAQNFMSTQTKLEQKIVVLDQ